MKFSEIARQLDKHPTTLRLGGSSSIDISELNQNLMAHTTTLTYLDLDGCQLNNGSLEQLATSLAQLEKLETLNLSANKFTDIGLSKITLPKSCRTLILEGTPIGDAGIDFISTQLPNLEVLWVRKCKLTDASIDAILQFRKLKKLWFVLDNSFTERGIKLLAKKIKELPLETLSLRCLDVTKTSPEVVAEFLDNLPSSIKELYISSSSVIGQNECCVNALIRLIRKPSSLQFLEMRTLLIRDENFAQRIMKALKESDLSADFTGRNPAILDLRQKQLCSPVEHERSQQEERLREQPLKTDCVFEL